MIRWMCSKRVENRISAVELKNRLRWNAMRLQNRKHYLLVWDLGSIKESAWPSKRLKVVDSLAEE